MPTAAPTPLHRAVEAGDAAKVRTLLAGGASATAATRLGITESEAARCLTLLVDSGIVSRTRAKYSVGAAEFVDTRGGRAALLRLKHHWSSIATQQLQAPPQHGDLHAYNVISVSHQDLARVRELLRATFREIRSLVAASQPAETVALVNLQLVGLLRGPTSPAGEGEQPPTRSL